MGYYSNVAYAIQGPKEKMIPIIMTYRLTYPDQVNAKQALDECRYSVVDGFMTVLYQNCSIKWYDYFEEVRAHMALFRAFREVGKVAGRFIRLGEEDGDNESEEYGNDTYELLEWSKVMDIKVDANETLESIVGANYGN